MISKVVIICIVAACVYGQGYQRPAETYKAFSNSYEVTDDEGNVQGHSASQDANGKVTGTILMRLINGLFRNARYEADGNGFRIVLESNEPGMGEDSPADATYNIQAPPAGIYETKYAPRRGVYA